MIDTAVEGTTNETVIHVRNFHDIIYSLITDSVDEWDVEIPFLPVGWDLWVSASEDVLSEQWGDRANAAESVKRRSRMIVDSSNLTFGLGNRQVQGSSTNKCGARNLGPDHDITPRSLILIDGFVWTLTRPLCADLEVPENQLTSVAPSYERPGYALQVQILDNYLTSNTAYQNHINCPTNENIPPYLVFLIWLRLDEFPTSDELVNLPTVVSCRTGFRQ